MTHFCLLNFFSVGFALPKLLLRICVNNSVEITKVISFKQALKDFNVLALLQVSWPKTAFVNTEHFLSGNVLLFFSDITVWV